MHADALPMSTKVGATLQRGNDISQFTDTLVNANNTSVAGLQAAIRAQNPAHADQANFRGRIASALGADGGITDSTLSGKTTAASVIALTNLGSLPNRDLYGD